MFGPARKSIRGWAALIASWWRRSQDREALMRMTDRDLKDIGLRRYDAYREARKPFWRA